MTDDPDDTTARLAADLRSLRSAAGNPTLQALAAQTGVSKSVISEALLGRRLPTENTIGALATALGGDRDAFVARRQRLDPRFANPHDTRDAGAPARVSRSRWRTIAVASASAVLASAVTSGAWALAWTNQTPAPLETQALDDETHLSDRLAHADGVDPMLTVCPDDRVLAASEQRLDGAVQVEMMYSNACMGVWGRVTRYDEQSSGNALSMRIYPHGDPDSSRSQERTATDVPSLYTPLLIEPDVDARVCGVATLTVDGTTTIELGPPLCI